VAALETPTPPEGFWGGNRAGNATPPPIRGRAAGGGGSTWLDRAFNRYAAPSFVIDQFARLADNGMELAREKNLAARGPRGQTDLMRQYRAQERFTQGLEGMPVVGHVASMIVEAVTGWKTQTAETLQDAEQQDARVELSKTAATRRRLHSNEVTIRAQHGGFAQQMARIAINGSEEYRAAKQTMNDMINAGDIEGGKKHFVEMSAWIERDMQIQRATATREQNIGVQTLYRSAQRQNLLARGETDQAQRNEIYDEFDARIAAEQDPARKAALGELMRATLGSYDAQRDRRHAWNAQDVRSRTRVNQALLDRDYQGARYMAINAEEERAGRDPNLTQEQRDANRAFYQSERDRAGRDKSDRERYTRMELTGEGKALALAAENRPMAGRASIAASQAINRATRMREQDQDYGNANLVLQNAVLEQKALRKQVFEGFESKEIDPTLTAFNSPRRGESTEKYLADIAANIRRLVANQAAGGDGAYTTD
jgi:hypothetical protein